MAKASRDAYLEDIRKTLAPYQALDGKGTVSRRGLLDVKKSLDLLTAEMSGNRRSSGSSGCDAGLGGLALLAFALLAVAALKRRANFR